MKSFLGFFMGLSIVLSLGCSKSDTDKFADSYCAEVAKCCSQAALPGDGKACHALMAFFADLFQGQVPKQRLVASLWRLIKKAQ